jgi:hypothetical protein
MGKFFVGILIIAGLFFGYILPHWHDKSDYMKGYDNYETNMDNCLGELSEEHEDHWNINQLARKLHKCIREKEKDRAESAREAYRHDN